MMATSTGRGRLVLAGVLVVSGIAFLAMGIWHLQVGNPDMEPASAGDTPNPSLTPFLESTPEEIDREYARYRVLGWIEAWGLPVLGTLLLTAGLILFLASGRPPSKS